ncbi:hypothetical protein ACUODJ_45870, partial [Escherichia sp. HC-CC]
QNLQPGATVPVTLTRADGSQEVVPCRCRIDTATELTYYQNDGILHCVISLLAGSKITGKQILVTSTYYE